MTHRIRILSCLLLTVLFFAVTSPVSAIMPPDEEQAKWLRDSPDLQDRIARVEAALKPLLQPDTVTMDDFGDELASDIKGNFGMREGDDGYIGRIDTNDDGIIDERDFLELAFISSDLLP